MKTTFRHRDSLNYYIYFNGKKLKFVNGCYSTSDEAEINHIKTLPLFGLKSEGAVIYEADETDSSLLKKLASRNLQIGDKPKYNPSNEQPLYPTKGAFYECVIDGSLHGNPSALADYIKEKYGEKKYNSMKFLMEPPVVKPFGKEPDTNPSRNLFTAEQVKGMTVAPVVGVYPIAGEVTERKEIRKLTIEQADAETEAIIEEEAKKVAAAAKKREIEKRKGLIQTAKAKVELPTASPVAEETKEEEPGTIKTETIIPEKKPVTKKKAKKKAKRKAKRKVKRKTKK